MGDLVGHAGGGFLVGAADGEEAVDLVAGYCVQQFEVNGVRCGGGMGWCGWEEVFVADGIDEGDDLDAVGEFEVFFRYGACGDSADCFTGTASAAATAGFDAVFHLVGVVGMTGPRVFIHCAITIVSRALVFVEDAEGDWGTECKAMFCAGLDLDTVFFVAGCSECGLARSTAGHLRLDVIFSERKAWGATVNDGADGQAVGFAIAVSIAGVRAIDCYCG